MSQQLVKVLVLAALLGLHTLGHAEDQNPFDAPVIRNEGPADGSANDPIVRNSVGDVSSIQDNSQANSQRGRREKLEDDAIPKGNAGVAAALAAGISLTAAGTPMVASPIPPVRMRGMELLAKAGLEFAQAAATAGTNQANQKAADAINKNADGPTGSQLQSPEDVKKEAAEKINTPELQQALGQAGINSDDFIDKLTSGQLTTPAAVGAAAGADMTGITPEMLAQSASANGTENLAQIVFADSTSNSPPTGSGTSGDSRGAFSPAASKAGDDGLNGAASASERYAQAQAMAAHALDTAKKSGADLANFNERDLIANYLGALQNKNAKSAFTASDLALYEVGIKRLRPKQNIFHVARTSYHGFGKWRGKRPARLAQAGPVVRTASTVK